MITTFVCAIDSCAPVCVYLCACVCVFPALTEVDRKLLYQNDFDGPWNISSKIANFLFQ